MQLAQLQGFERATLGVSTLHLFSDFFSLIAEQPVAVYIDSGSYPIAHWGAERAAARGTPVSFFPHFDVEALKAQLDEARQYQLRPIIVCDGYCTTCGMSAPISSFLRCAGEFGGQIVLDDTQSLGIFGSDGGSEHAYGLGGGGSVRWNNVESDQIVAVCSLSKGFGVPIAALSGSDKLVEWFESKSETRVHCGPPSIPLINAAQHALLINQSHGDNLRRQLAENVAYFRTRLQSVGLFAAGGIFPFQALTGVSKIGGALLNNRLSNAGVKSILVGGNLEDDVSVGFLINARHRRSEIDAAIDALVDAIAAEGTENEYSIDGEIGS
jgi:8-amino-7-oxononanoate synthase